MIILSIETSCDETAAAIVKFSKGKAEVLANVVSSQIKIHSKFGGVVPLLASRMHLKNMVPVLKRAFKEAEKTHNSLESLPTGQAGSDKRLQRSENKEFSKVSFEVSELSSFGKLIDYIAVTNGPGLIPALMIGTQAAKTLSYALNKPLIPIHHIEGHIYANWLRPIEKVQSSKFKVQSYKLWNPEFPILCLIVSGGHTQLVLMKKDLDYKIIGETVDDAAGEAFDKVAKLLGLGYPGGPVIEKMSRLGDRNKFKFPRPMINSKDFNFSFSGLKTAVLYKWNFEFGILNLEDRKEKAKLQNSGADFNSAKLQKPPNPPYQGECLTSKFQIPNSKFDIAASFQQAVIDVLISKTIAAAKEYKVKNIILGGGVSANKELQKQLEKAINKEIPNSKFQIPNSNLSTDNALMIAVAGYYRILNNKNISDWKNVEADANLVLELAISNL